MFGMNCPAGLSGKGLLLPFRMPNRGPVIIFIKVNLMYTSINFKSKAALKRAMADGQRITVFSPGVFPAPDNGAISLEGPHYPQPHTWYASGIMKDGFLVSIK
jgi:hypothetical protein